jgi:hypothetical protein
MRWRGGGLEQACNGDLGPQHHRPRSPWLAGE